MHNNSVAVPEPLPEMTLLHMLVESVKEAKVRNPKITNKALSARLSNELIELLKDDCVAKTW